MDNSKNEQSRLFWDLYFQNRFVELTRTTTEVSGKYTRPLHSGQSYFSDRTFDSLKITREQLKSHEYESDGRFSEILKAPRQLNESVQKIMDGSYPYREPPPFGASRMAELMRQLSARFEWPHGSSLTSEVLDRAARSIISQFRHDDGQPLNALLWLLGERRDRLFSDVLVSAIEESERLSKGHKDKIPSSVINTAFEGLCKINDKTFVNRLLTIMDHSEHSGRLRVAALFKRLLSTTQLLSLETLGENFYAVGYWERVISKCAGYSEAQWDRFDAGSLFWDNRYLAAKRLAPGDECLRQLSDDEVSFVRKLAKTNLIQLP